MSTAGPSKPLLDRIKAAGRRKASREVRGDLAQELLVQLSSEAHELRTCARNLEDSLFSDAFPLLDYLLPLLSAAEIADDGSMNTSDYVRSCLILVATVCSPKEVVMGVEQALAELSRFESDDEEDDDEAAGAEVDVRDSAFQLACMTTMYSNALPRIKTKRPLQFLSPAGAAIADGLRDFVSVGAFSAPSAASNSTSAPLQGDPLAKEAFRGVLLFVRSVCSWVVVSLDKEREVTELGSALALFEALLHQAVVLLHLFAPANLASTYFYRRFPTYRPRGPPPEPTDGELAWELFDSIVYKLGVEPAKLLEMAASSRHPPQPQRLSSFVMLAHMVASPRGITPSSLGCTPESLLANTLDVVRRGLAHPVDKLAEDEALFWLWWCVEQQLELEEPLSKDVLFDLVDVLTPLTSLSPNPQTRFLAFRLIGRLVSTAHGDTLEGEATQVSLLRQLVVDCPSASLRAASVGLVKELLMDKLKLPLSSPSLFLDESFFSSSPLGTALLRFDPPNLAPGTLAASEFLEQHRAGVMERLSLLFVLLKRDQHNRTGVAAPSVVADLRAQLLDTLGAQLGRWLAARSTDAGDEGALEAEAALELELVQELLARVGEAVREVAERQASEPYDPYIPGSNPNQPGGGPGPSGSAPGGSGGKNTKTAQIQQQIDDTVGIMRENITKVAERGERLDALQDKTDNLAQSAQGFRRGANRVRKQMWWKDMKMRILIAVGVALLVVVIVVPIVVKK